MEEQRAAKLDALVNAIGQMAAMIEFFPSDPAKTEVITAYLDKLTQTPQQLQWLAQTACLVMPKWTSYADLRGLYCTKFAPADGYPSTECTIPGFSIEDIERSYFEWEAQQTALRIEGWRQEQKKLQGECMPPLEPLTTEQTELRIPCPACKATRWTTFAVPGTFDQPGGSFAAQCANGHRIDLELLKSGKLGKFIAPVEPNVDEAELERLKKAPMSETERARKIADLEAAIRQRQSGSG